MSGAMNRHCIPGLTITTGPDGNFCGSVREYQTMHTGFSAYTYWALCQRPGSDTEETGRYDLAWKDLVCSVLNASANSNELSKV